MTSDDRNPIIKCRGGENRGIAITDCRGDPRSLMSSRELDHEIERARAVAACVDVEEAPPERGPRDLMREVIRGRSSEVIRAVEGSPVGARATRPNEGGHQRSSGAT
jgi:hypothetical protein